MVPEGWFYTFGAITYAETSNPQYTVQFGVRVVPEPERDHVNPNLDRRPVLGSAKRGKETD